MLEDATNRELVNAWRGGSSAAASILVGRYMARLTALARSRLSRKLARRLDPDDIVLSAWRSFFVATGRDRIDVPADDNLWPLLVTMTLRKLARQTAKHSADRRAIQNEAALQHDFDWCGIVSEEPTSAEAAMVTDEIELLMSRLSDNDREILTRRLQGGSHADIAASVGCSERTVRRSMLRIRELYAALNDGEKSERCYGSEASHHLRSPAGRRGTDPERLVDTDDSEGKVSSIVLEGTPTIAFDDIVLREFAGQGAFGKVYRATRHSDGTTVAVKFLRKKFWRNTTAMTQLIREVSVVGGLSHPGIVRCSGWGATEHGAVFAVLEWVDGETLEDWRRSFSPSVPDVVQCVISLCDALAAAHKAGVVHADLSPRNILRRKNGSCLLADFGFSRLIGELAATASAGTPGFLAPEQLSDVFGTVSPQTDLFGIGGVLYFLMTGKAPFVGRDTAEILAETLSLRTASRVSDLVPDVPHALDQLIAELLAKEPADRLQSIEKVEARLALIQRQLATGS